MAICYNCKRKEKIHGQKYVGEKICFGCHDSLGLSICLSVKEKNKAYLKKGGYQSFEELVQIVKPRRELYNELAAKCNPSRSFSIERPNYTGEDKIEIDEQGELIRITERYTDGIKFQKNPMVVYIRYSVIISVMSDSALSCLTFNLLGQAEDYYFFRSKEKEKDLFDFFERIGKVKA